MGKGGRLREHSAQNIYIYAGSDQIEVLGTSLNLQMIMQAEMHISTIGSASVSSDSGVQSPADVMPICIYQNCAEACHEALCNDAEYVGSNLSYCDCHAPHRMKIAPV